MGRIHPFVFPSNPPSRIYTRFEAVAELDILLGILYKGVVGEGGGSICLE